MPNNEQLKTNKVEMLIESLLEAEAEALEEQNSVAENTVQEMKMLIANKEFGFETVMMQQACEWDKDLETTMKEIYNLKWLSVTGMTKADYIDSKLPEEDLEEDLDKAPYELSELSELSDNSELFDIRKLGYVLSDSDINQEYESKAPYELSGKGDYLVSW